MIVQNNFQTSSAKVNNLALQKVSTKLRSDYGKDMNLSYDNIDYNNPDFDQRFNAEYEANCMLSALKAGDPSSAAENTKVLQNAINYLSESGGGTLNVPAGEFYFGQGGTASNGEMFAILCRSNVHIKGAGTSGSSQTVFKPIRSYSPTDVGSMDMFFFNHYSTGTNLGRDADGSYYDFEDKINYTYTSVDGSVVEIQSDNIYLIDADFSDFVIDGSGAVNVGGKYTTAGKGFMINLFKDCDWNNVIVKDTAATGFGMDCPINCTITNCLAVGCGKQATTDDGGASGFGIGTGYANNESISIENCEAYNNTKYGIFFEHQSRFQKDTSKYPATTSNGFIVTNCLAGGNLYNYGGIRAYDVLFQNVKSVTDNPNIYEGTRSLVARPLSAGTNSFSNIMQKTSNFNLDREVTYGNTAQHIYFSDYSVNCSSKNCTLDSNISDLGPYKPEIIRAVNSGYMKLKNMNEFGSKDSLNRMDVMQILYKYSGMPNDVDLTYREQIGTNTYSKINAYNENNNNFSDLAKYTKEDDGLEAILWGVKNKIVTPDLNFNPTSTCTRSQIVTMLYRMSGSPKVTGTTPFNDIENNSWYTDALNWAYNSGIIKGISATEFAPNMELTKEQMAIILSRYTDLNNPSVYSI